MVCDPDVLELVYWPHPALRRATRPLEPDEFGADLRAVAERLAEVMHEARGIGLAAPQVGLERSLLVVNPSATPGSEIYLVNPRVVDTDGTQVGDEGCLSFPRIVGKVRRHQWVRVLARDLDGEPMSLEGEGLLARCLEHEIDHLQGIVFLSKFTPAARLAARRRVRELEEHWGPIYAAAAPAP